MSTPITTNFVVMRNDDLPVIVTFKDDNGVVVDITGSTCFFTVKENNTDLDINAKIAKSWAIHLDPSNGITQFNLVPADTVNLLGRYYFDIQVKLVSGLIYTPVHGIFTVLADSTLRIV